MSVLFDLGVVDLGEGITDLVGLTCGDVIGIGEGLEGGELMGDEGAT